MHDTKAIEQERPRREDGEVELTDLEPLDDAKGSKSFWIASTLLDWQHSPQRQRYKQYWRIASTPAILLLLVMLFSLNHVSSSLIVNSFRTALFAPSHASSLVAALPQQDGITCLVDTAWSPDSNYIAVLGYGHTCLQEDDATGLVNFYDAHSRALLAQVHPGGAIVRALENSLPLAPRPPFIIDYVHIIWSPDGHRLACTFNTVSVQPPVNGVLLMDRDGGHAQVLLQPQSPTAPFYAEWDLARGRAVPFTPPPTALSVMPLPPAVSYRWGTNGTLLPESLLTPTTVPAAPPLGPVGKPDGGPSFTIWQLGSASVTSFADASRLYTWSTTFAAWSPDGRYLVDGIALFGLLKPPGWRFPSPSSLAMAWLDQAPLLPIHDAAFLKVLALATVFAWSPSGHLLAVYQAGKGVGIYDCAHGHRLASFRLQGTYMASPADTLVLRWSPDGSHLLLSSVRWGMVTIWGPNLSPVKEWKHASLLTRF